MATKPFPFKWEELTAEETARVQADFPESAVNDLVRYEHGLIMPRDFIGIDERLYNFTLRDDDIWIVTYPKVGTTWTQEMVWMLVNDVDKEAGALPQMLRSPFMEVGSIMGKMAESAPFPPIVKELLQDPIAFADKMTGRRVLKAHVPIEFLPPDLTKRCKVIYVARNPKDTCVSFFKHNQSMPGHGFVGDFAEFTELFKSGLLLFGDYWTHILSGWKVRNHPNVKFLWFEDMKKEQRKIIEDLCVFLNHPLTPEQVDTLVDHLKFDNMKMNPNANPTAGMNLKSDFMRKGQVGDWKNFFTTKKTEEWASWIEEKTRGTGLAEKISPM